MYAVENRLKLWFTGVRHIRIELPKYVAFIIDKLYENGYEAFAVGGCVRDAVMGRIPHDWDITTNALPKQVKSIFNKTIDTGIKHGTVTVMLNRVGYEVTTYRIDGEYTDGRHPKEVVFTPNLTEDLRRRDFTINAMAYNDKTGIIDEFDGIDDIQNKVIRCVGVPEDRFNEDALRMLRAVRFSAQLDFSIDNDTYNAIGKLYKNLSLISKERIQTELTKIITSENPGRIKDICRLGLDRYVFGDNSVLSGADISVYEKVSYIMEKLPDNSYLRYAGLLTYETDIENVLRGLKLDNKTINTVARLVYNKNKELSTNKADIRRAVVAIGEDIFSEYYLEYMKALIKVKHEGITLSLEDIDTISLRYQEIIADNECLKLNDMAVHGRDLKALGLPDGKLIGDILKILFDRVLENPQLNNKEILIEMAKKLI